MQENVSDASEQKRKEALQCLERARDPKSSQDERYKAMMDASAILEEGLQINPANHKVRFLLLSCAMNLDQFERAKKEGLKIYNALTPEQRARMGDAVLYISLAHASKMLGDIDDAIRFAREASEAYPDDPHPHMILGELYEASDLNAEAESMCRKALLHHEEASCKHHLNPMSVYFTLCCLGASLIKQGKYSEAERFLDQAKRMGSSSALALRHLVDVYHFQGRLDEALQAAQSIADQEPDNEEIRQKIDVLQQTSQSEGEDGDVSNLRSLAPRGIDRADRPPSSAGSYDVVEVRPVGSDLPTGCRATSAGSENEKASGRSQNGSMASRRSRKSDRSNRGNSRKSGDENGDAKQSSGNKGGGDFLCCCFDRGPGGDPAEEDREQLKKSRPKEVT